MPDNRDALITSLPPLPPPVSQRPPDVLNRYKLPTITIFVGMIVAIFAFIIMLTLGMKQLERNFTHDARMNISLLQMWVKQNLREVESLSGSLAQDSKLARDQFHKVAGSLVERGSFQAVYWVAPDMAGDNKLLVVSAMPAGKDAPMVLGYPLLSSEIMNVLRTRQPTASEPIILPSQVNNQMLVGFLYPITDDSQTKGVVVALLNINAVFEKSLQQIGYFQNTETYLFDAPLSGPEKLLYGHNNEFMRMTQMMRRETDSSAIQRSVGFSYSTYLDMLNKRWKIIFLPTASYMAEASTQAPWIVMGACLAFTGVAVIFLLQLVGQKARTEQEVWERTAELTQATMELESAKDAAEAANMAKSDFLANMSHEIRTPLNSMIGITEVLLETPLSQQQSHYVKTVLNSSENLLTIINDILDFSKIESGKLDLAPVSFDFHSMLDEVAKLFAIRAAEKELPLSLRVDVKTNTPRYLIGDPVRIRQIVANLISNAIKFTEKGSVQVTVETLSDFMLRPDQVKLRIAVRDTGIGIPHEKLQVIFEKFSQADVSTTRKYGGTGLGLSICKELVAMMDGEMEVESEPGKGSTFSVTLTLARGQEVREALPGAQETKVSSDEESNSYMKGAKILLAEDNAANREVAVILLENLECHVITARNGEEAVEAASEEEFDLILMDCQMPEMDGFQASQILCEMKRRGDMRDTPIIALTANAMMGDRERCLNAGMDDYLTKPLHNATLRRMLMQWLPPREKRVLAINDAA